MRRTGTLSALAVLAVVCAACGGGTAGTGGDDGTSEAASGSDSTTTVPEPEAASGSGSTTVPEPEAAGGSGTTTLPEPEATLEQPDDDGGKDRDGAGDDVAVGTTVPEPQNAEPTVGVIAAIEVVAGEAATVDLSSFFGDPDGDELGYEATSSDVAVAVVSVSGSSVEVEGTGEGVATVTVTASDPGGLSVQQSFDVAVRRVVVSLEAPELVPFTELGETRELRVSADYSDGSREAVDAALVEWQSSDPWVVSVSEGLVTAVGGGNATITAAYEGRTMEVPASVRFSTRSARSVRVIYAAPSDREFRADMSEHLANVTVDLQSWYRRQLDGLTFSLYEATPEECRMSEPADYYVRGNAWEKVVEGLQSCAPVQHGSPDFIWVVYPILSEPCDEPQELGAGGWGLTIMPENDGPPVLGLVQDECGEGSYFVTSGHKIGGPGHELAHTMGVPHPPGCDAGLPTCDYGALISSGYVDYPDTYLRADDKEVLIRSPFIGTEPVPGRDPSGASNASSVNGVALGSDGEPVEGLRVSLVAESFWSWGETGEDGTFAVRVPEGSSGPSIVSIHAGDAGDCRWLGYHGPDGVTTARALATQVDAGNGNVTGIEIRLPVGADDLCPDTRKVTGTVLGPDGRPAEGIWLWLEAFEGWLRVGRDGTFEFSVPEDWTGSGYVLSIQAPEVEDCGEVGYFGSDGFTTRRQDASLEMSGIGSTGIEIRLPATPVELCRGRITLTGEVLGPDGEPLEGIWMGLLTETGFYPWEWGQTGPDGTFEIPLLGAWTGSVILGVHAAEVPWPCSLLGYFGPGGFTAARDTATRLEAGDVDASGFQIGLPASPDELLPYRVSGHRCGGPVGNPVALDSAVGDMPEIRGTLVGPDGQPLAGILIWAWSGDIDSSGSTLTSDNGSFAMSVPGGTFTLDVYAAADGSCVGQYDGESVTNDYSEAVRIDVAGQDIGGITIRLPALPQDLPSGQC